MTVPAASRVYHDSMVDQIAECAERIQAVLEEAGEINILHLSEHLSQRSVVVYQALGWLAYEGGIRYRRTGSRVLVSLMPSAALPGAAPGRPGRERHAGSQH